MQEVTVELTTPFPYSVKGKGEQEDASFITLFPPTFKQISHLAPIKQAFIKALTSTSSSKTPEEIAEAKRDAEEAKTEDDDKLTGEQVMTTLYASDCNMASVLLYAQELFKSGAALVEGESKLTVPLMEKMAVPDFEKCLGDYIANFILPSLMDGH